MPIVTQEAVIIENSFQFLQKRTFSFNCHLLAHCLIRCLYRAFKVKGCYVALSIHWTSNFKPVWLLFGSEGCVIKTKILEKEREKINLLNSSPQRGTKLQFHILSKRARLYEAFRMPSSSEHFSITHTPSRKIHKCFITLKKKITLGISQNI